MNNFKEELEKAQKYHSFDNQQISSYMYQTFGVIILSLIFYKYVILYFYPDLPKDFLAIFLIFSCVLFCFYVQKKLNTQEKKQKSIQFEDINLFEFLQKYVSENKSNLPHQNIENFNLYTCQLYLAITGNIMKDKLQRLQNNEELNHFYEQVENKTFQMKSYSILLQINSFKR